MVEIFKKYNEESFKDGITPRTRQSMEWFQKHVDDITSLNREKIFSQGQRTSNIFIGTMIMFFYDPKWERKLPYWDRFPLVIIIDEAPGGFLGLNLHYLPIDLRARFLQNLLLNTTDNNFDKQTRFELTYDYLKNARRMRYFKPCIKRYITKQVQGNFAIIPPEDWEVATFLPTEDFQKQTKKFVHRESRDKAR